MPNYRQAPFYKSLKAEERRRVDQYKKDLNIDEVQMCLLLRRQELREYPKEKKQEGNKPAETMVIAAIIFFLGVTTMSREKIPMLMASLILIAVSIVYMTGFLNPYQKELNAVNKELKKYPKADEFANWLKNRGKEAAKAE